MLQDDMTDLTVRLPRLNKQILSGPFSPRSRGAVPITTACIICKHGRVVSLMK